MISVDWVVIAYRALRRRMRCPLSWYKHIYSLKLLPPYPKRTERLKYYPLPCSTKLFLVMKCFAYSLSSPALVTILLLSCIHTLPHVPLSGGSRRFSASSILIRRHLCFGTGSLSSTSFSFPADFPRGPMENTLSVLIFRGFPLQRPPSS